MQLRVTHLGAVTAIALLLGAVALLSRCDGRDQQPVATTPTATAMAPPSPTAGGGGVDATETAGSTRPANTPTIEPHGRDGPATSTPVPATPTLVPGPDPGGPTATPTLVPGPDPGGPTATPTLVPGPDPSGPTATPTLVPGPDPGGPTATPGAIAQGRPAAGSGTAPRDWRPTPTPEPGPDGDAGPRTIESTASAFSSGESVLYTWQDGEYTRRVHLQPNLVLQDPADNTSEDIVVRAGRMENIVQRTARHDEDTLPVFRSASGSIMTLPGGVLLVLDAQWDQPRIDIFFATNGIAKGSARALDFAPNAFFIDTAPGLPSLELANALAAGDGVVIASPNWRREVVAR